MSSRRRALLKKAGLASKEVEIFTADASAGFVEAATLFAEQVAEAGGEAQGDDRQRRRRTRRTC